MSYIYNCDGCIMIKEDPKKEILESCDKVKSKLLDHTKGKSYDRIILTKKIDYNLNFNDIKLLQQMHTF